MFMDKKSHENYFDEAVNVAKEATCLRSKCGSIIVKGGKIIGRGFNSPPGEIETQRRCLNSKKDYDNKITDKTCCIHAEQRAMFDVLKNNPEKIKGASLYFIRLDSQNNVMFAGKPYCTICSKMALDLGIKKFGLYHEKGIVIYSAKEYNDLSYDYRS